MRDAGMVGILGELLLQDRGGLEIRRIRLVCLRLRAGDVERAEDLRFVVLRILRRERLVRLCPAFLTRALRAVGEIGVVRGDRFDVVALALRLGADAPTLLDCRLRCFGALRRGALPGERVVIRIDAMPQVAIAHSGSFFSTSRNACSPALNQNECSIATARARSAWTAGLHEFDEIDFSELALAFGFVGKRRRCQRE